MSSSSLSQQILKHLSEKPARDYKDFMLSPHVTQADKVTLGKVLGGLCGQGLVARSSDNYFAASFEITDAGRQALRA